ncbi:MAG: hypothetical protein ACOC5R_06180 [Elusimicrobiota bacterium]
MKIRLRENLTLISLLVLLMVIGVAPLHAQESLDDLPLEKLENPTEVSELLDNFSRLEFRIRGFEDGDLTQETEIKYRFVGKEEVQGTQADKVTLRGKGIEPMDVWFDEGEIVQFEIDGERIPAQMADMVKEDMYQAIFFPFYYVDRLNLEALEEAGVTRVSKSQEMIGDMQVDITKIEIEKLYDADIEEFEFESAILRIAEFEDFLMVSSYEIKSTDNEELKYEVEMVELR